MSSLETVVTSNDGASRGDIAIFGLSGNPPTGQCGHAGIVNYLVKSGDFSEVWVLPVFRHQFSSKHSLAPFNARVEMCQIAFECYSSESCVVRVLTVEQEVENLVSRHGTVDTLRFIRERCPGVRLHLILGSDTYNDIAMGKWKQGERLCDEASLHVIERMDLHSPTRLQPALLPRVQVHRVPGLAYVSSSSLRLLNPVPLWPLSLFLPPALIPRCSLEDPAQLLPGVLRYMRTHELFSFSGEFLRAMKRSRLALLGVLCGGVLKYLCTSSSSSLVPS